MNPTISPEQERIHLQNEVRRLELELQSAWQDLARLRGELETARLNQSDAVGERVTAQQQDLFRQAAAPAAQLLTQASLLEAGKPLQARDVLAVARRLLVALEQSGLVFEGRPGQTAAFDPDRHYPITSVEIEPGQTVVIRFAGISHQGSLLQRAGVEPAGEGA